MNEADQPHPAIRWLTVKWPSWLKALAAVGTIGGAIGTVFGLVGTCQNGVKSHDDAVRAKAIAEQERVERDNKIDDTLKYHGQQIWSIDRKTDVIDKKLDEIKREVKK